MLNSGFSTTTTTTTTTTMKKVISLNDDYDGDEEEEDGEEDKTNNYLNGNFSCKEAPHYDESLCNSGEEEEEANEANRHVVLSETNEQATICSLIQSASTAINGKKQINLHNQVSEEIESKIKIFILFSHTLISIKLFFNPT